MVSMQENALKWRDSRMPLHSHTCLIKLELGTANSPQVTKFQMECVKILKFILNIFDR